MNALRLNRKMAHTIKRCLAAMMAIALIVTILPNSALAESPEHEGAQAAAVEFTEQGDDDTGNPDVSESDPADNGESGEPADNGENPADNGDETDGGEADPNEAAAVGAVGAGTYATPVPLDWGDYINYFTPGGDNFDEYAAGTIFALSEDIDLDADFQAVILKQVTIDGNGYTLKATDNNGFQSNGSYAGIGMFVVTNGGNLTLSNITLDADEKDRLIDIVDGTVTLDEYAVLTGGISSTFGGAVHARSSGTLILDGGEITANTAYGTGSGGSGVYVNSGTFEMKGGSVTGNGEPYMGGTGCVNGGGVYVVNGGTFSIEDGEISNNKATYGAGVCIDSGTFTMTGGEISGNNAVTIVLSSITSAASKQ